MNLGSGCAINFRSCSVATGDNFMAAFLARSGRRGFWEVLEAAGEVVVGFDFCASPSRRLTLDNVLCDAFWYDFRPGGGNSAEMEVSAPPLLRGGGKEVGSE